MPAEIVPVIGCAGGCKKTQLNDEAAEKAGWSCLQITGRWRCGPCEVSLRGVESAMLSDGVTTDPIPRHSIGALKKLPEPPELHERVRP